MAIVNRDKMTEADLLCLLRSGVKRSSDLIAQITEYHGGAVTTEYMLTSDIARVLIEKGYEAKVEYLNRNIVNGMTMRKPAASRKKFGSKRIDIAVLYTDIVPLAMIEVKIGVKTLGGTKSDLIKITNTIDALNPRFASSVWGASVFQVHIPGSKIRYEERHFRIAMAEVEATIKSGLTTHAKDYKDYNFDFHDLQSKNAGYTARALEYDDGEAVAWGEDGHATRYYAVLIKSTIPKPKPPQTFAELKTQK